VAAGTAHGLGVVDFVQRRIVYAKCTLNPAGQLLVDFPYFYVFVADIDAGGMHYVSVTPCFCLSCCPEMAAC